MRHFLTGFWIGILSFLLINILAAHLLSDCGLPAVLGLDSCADDIARTGFPLMFFEEGGFDYRSTFNSFSLLIDIIIAILFSTVLGFLFVKYKNGS